AAGTHLLASRSRLAEIMITHRPASEVAHEIDREAAVLMRDVVLKRFPEHGVLGDRGSNAHDGRPVWVVNPLDGSANYVRGYPQYAVTVALVVDGEPLIGVVYDPLRNEFFGAIHGRGAVLNGALSRCGAARATIGALASRCCPAARWPPAHPACATASSTCSDRNSMPPTAHRAARCAAHSSVKLSPWTIATTLRPTSAAS